MAKLKIYADENVDIRVAEGLRRRGIKAFSAHEKNKTGISDIEHFTYASKQKAVIFTHDHHFLEIAKSYTDQGKKHWVVIYVSMTQLSIGECIKRLALYAEVLSAEEMADKLEYL